MAILTQEELATLNRMVYHYRRYLFSGIIGEYIHRRRGSSNEFYDYKEYAPGDDTRHINWKSYLRHGKLHTRTFHEEAYFYLHILIDNSRSMAMLEDKKFLAIKFACAMAYIAFSIRLPVEVELLCRRDQESARRTARNIHDLEFFLRSNFRDESSAAPEGILKTEPDNQSRNAFKKDRDELVQSALEYSRANRRKSGIILFISDFLYPPGKLNRVLKTFLSNAFEVVAVQVISESETPEHIALADGTVKLVDSESGEVYTVHFNQKDYEESYSRHQNKIETVLTANSMPVLQLVSGRDVVNFIRSNLQRLGIIR